MRLEREYLARQTKRQNRPKRISAMTPGDEKSNRKGVSCLRSCGPIREGYTCWTVLWIV